MKHLILHTFEADEHRNWKRQDHQCDRANSRQNFDDSPSFSLR